MLCDNKIIDYIVEPVYRVKLRLQEGYHLYGQLIYRPDKEPHFFQTLVKVAAFINYNNVDFSVALTSFEKKCIKLLMQECTFKEMANRLYCSKRKVEVTFAKLRRQFSCQTNIGVIAKLKYLETMPSNVKKNVS